MKYFNLISVYIEDEKIKLNIDNICLPNHAPNPREASFISETVRNHRYGLTTVNNTFENVYPVFKELAQPIQSEKSVIFKKPHSNKDKFPIQDEFKYTRPETRLEKITEGARSREEAFAMMMAALDAKKQFVPVLISSDIVSQLQLTSYTYELPTDLEQALAMMSVFDEFINVSHENFVNTCTLDDFAPKNEHNFYVNAPLKNEPEANLYEKILQLIQEEKPENKITTNRENRNDNLVTHEELYADYYIFLRCLLSLNNPPKAYQMILDIAQNIYDFCAKLSDQKVSRIIPFAECLTDERLINLLRTNSVAQKVEHYVSIPDKKDIKPLIWNILRVYSKHEFANTSNPTIAQQGIFGSSVEKPQTSNISEYSYKM